VVLKPPLRVWMLDEAISLLFFSHPS